jgi:hypothetical protein
MQKEISLNICGDFYLSTLSPDKNYFSKEILEVFINSDFNVINLESPVASKKENKILKDGPNMSGSPYTFSYLNKIRTNLVTLANNHIMDYGDQGLSDTLKGCHANSISYVGAGMSLEEAKRPILYKYFQTRISILNFTENEFSTPYENEPGANPLNIIDNIRQIREAKKISDLVIVIIHGGHEMYHLPSPRMVTQYRFYAENGASVIVGHHTHCISGFEVHQDVPIFYGLGNFLFTERSEFESWYTGLILNLRITEDAEIKWDLIPIRQHKDNYTLSVLTGSEKQTVLSEVRKYSAIISNSEELSRSWKCFVRKKYDEVLDIFSPVQFLNNIYIIKILQKSGLNHLFRRKRHFAKILNHLRCESLSDLSKDIISKSLEN